MLFYKNIHMILGYSTLMNYHCGKQKKTVPVMLIIEKFLTPVKNTFKTCSLTFLIGILGSGTLSAQTDSLVMKNGQFLIGEIKNMTRSVVVVETDYSDSDFKIDWDEVSQIFSNQFYLVTLSSGKRLNASISTDSTDIDNVILTSSEGPVNAGIGEIVYLKPVKGDFFSRMTASVSVGYNITKNNNLHQFNSRINLGYLANLWSLAASYDAVRSTQDDVDPVKRTDATFDFYYFLKKDWFLLFSQEFLSNDEQLLKLRSTSKAGLGKYITHTNSTTFGVSAGAVWNNESFTDDTPQRNSAESFFGAQLDMFDIGDLSLLTAGTVYPSLTEKGRVRIDFKFDLKYDLPHDFFITLGYTHNFDNQPIEGASKNDYVFQTSIGWEL